MIVRNGLLQQTTFPQMRNRSIEPLAKSFAAHLLEVAFERMPFRNRKLRKRIIDLAELQVATVNALHSSRADLRMFREGTLHLLGRLDVELLRIELEPVRVVHAAGSLNAKQNLVCPRI